MSDKKRCRGIAVHRSLLIGTTSTPLSQPEMLSSPPEHTHKWTVAVRSAASNPLPPLNQKELAMVGSNLNPASGGQDGAGLQEGTAAEQSRISTRGRETETDYHRLVGGKDDISHFIKRVQFRLHETYPSPTRNLDKPPYQVTETGWGEFEIQIKIFFVNEANEKPLTYFHHLKLHPWQPIPGSSLAYPNPLLQNPTNPNQKLDSMEVDKDQNQTQEGEGASKEKKDGDVEMADGDATKENEKEKENGGGDENQVTTESAENEKNESSQNNENKGEESNPPSSLTNESSISNQVSSSSATSSQPKLPIPPVVHSWQYEEIVFPEPTEAFFDILNSNVPTPLPETSAQAFTDPTTYQQFLKLRDELASKNYQASLPSNEGENSSISKSTRTSLTNKKQLLTPPHPIHSPTGYLTESISMETIDAEGDRLERARIESVRQLEKGRERLIAMERKLKELRNKSKVLVGSEVVE